MIGRRLDVAVGATVGIDVGATVGATVGIDVVGIGVVVIGATVVVGIGVVVLGATVVVGIGVVMTGTVELYVTFFGGGTVSFLESTNASKHDTYRSFGLNSQTHLNEYLPDSVMVGSVHVVRQ
jgi:hypothetical protein